MKRSPKRLYKDGPFETRGGGGILDIEMNCETLGERINCAAYN